MLLDSKPERVTIQHGETSEEQHIATALLLMNEPGDDGLTSGWYWTHVPGGASNRDLTSAKRWRGAVQQQQGPFRDADAAVRGAEHWSPERTAFAILLRQVSDGVLTGETAAKWQEIGEWVENHDMVAKARAGTAPEAATGADPDAKPVDSKARTSALKEKLRTAELGERPEAADADDAFTEEPDTEPDNART